MKKLKTLLFSDSKGTFGFGRINIGQKSHEAFPLTRNKFKIKTQSLYTISEVYQTFFPTSYRQSRTSPILPTYGQRERGGEREREIERTMRKDRMMVTSI